MAGTGYFNVPESLIELSKTYKVYCNLRPNQRKEITDVLKTRDREKIFLEVQIKAAFNSFLSEPINPFLKTITRKTRVAIFIQGYDPKDLCLVTTLLESVYWDSEDYPRLDFDYPEALNKMLGRNMWGSFVIAIAPVTASIQLYGKRVSDESLFIEVIKKNGIPIKRIQREKIEYGMRRIPEFLKHKELILGL
ncbi:MAG: hypothetical protein WC099_02985 [Candidatus Paceibacterota bacterium]